MITGEGGNPEKDRIEAEYREAVQRLSGTPEAEILRKMADDARKHRLKELEDKLLYQKAANRQRDWEAAKIEDARWARILLFGLASEFPDKSGPEYRYYRILLQDAYRLGVVGIESAINQLTANCLDENKALKAEVKALKAELKRLKGKARD